MEERKKRQKELDERATTVPPPIRREARLEFDQRSAAVDKYQTPLDEDSKEEPVQPEPATIGKHYRAINYDLWTYWRMVHGGGAASASHVGAFTPCVVSGRAGGLFFDFEAPRVTWSPRRRPEDHASVVPAQAPASPEKRRKSPLRRPAAPARRPCLACSASAACASPSNDASRNSGITCRVPLLE